MAERPPARSPLLEVENLQVGLPGARHGGRIIDGMSLRIDAGEVVALVGESGCGKTMTALSFMRLLPAGAAITAGRILFAGEDILAMPEAQLNRLRGGRIAMLFQQPQTMLDPTSRVGVQVAEPLRLHRGLRGAAQRQRVVELLREVGIAEPELRARAFAHELSGGMAQRVMIAAAMSADPELLIADEPTTALDVTVQVQILKLLHQEKCRRRLAILLITHDLTVVSALADRVVVMYAGRVVEEGPNDAILHAPKHPYTRALVQCSRLQGDDAGRLFSIPGAAAQARDLKEGCRFQPRCPESTAHGIAAQCAHQEPDLAAYGGGCKARCWAVATAEMRGAPAA